MGDGSQPDDETLARRELKDYTRAFAASGQSSARFVWRRDRRLITAALVRDGQSVRIELGGRIDPPGDLTLRELEVLTFVALGASNAQIAALLVVSPRTISTHVERILRKLDVKRRAAAALTARERGLLVLPLPEQPGAAALTADAMFDQAAASEALAAVQAPRMRKPKPQRTLRLGSAFPAPRTPNGDGAEMRRGATLAIEQVNASGGIAGQRIEHMVVDIDPSSPGSVRDGMTALLEKDVDGITVGFVTAWEAAYDTLKGTGVPFLNASTSEAQVAATAADPDAFSGCFQTDPTEMAYGLGMVQLLDSEVCAPVLGERPRTISIVGASDPFSTSLEAAVRRALVDTGWEVLELGSRVDNDDAVIAELRDLDPTVVVNTNASAIDLGAFQKAFAASGTEALVHAFYAPSHPGFLTALGPFAEGMLWSTAGGLLPGPLGQRFREQYEERFGRPPDMVYGPHCYDQVQILATAWALAGGGRDRRAVTQAIRSRVHRGVCGSYYLDNPHQANPSYPISTADPSLGMAHLHVQVQEGRHRLVAPAIYGHDTGVIRTIR